MTDKVFHYIKEKQESSDNYCGTTVNAICTDLDLKMKDVLPILNELFKSGEIIKREGINSNLVFLKKYKHKHVPILVKIIES